VKTDEEFRRREEVIDVKLSHDNVGLGPS
jgi:hypothetical protein